MISISELETGRMSLPQYLIPELLWEVFSWIVAFEAAEEAVMPRPKSAPMNVS